MSKPKASILISSHDRLALLRRTLWSVAYRPPPVSFEVVVADDGSDEDVLGLLRDYSACFPWTFVRVDPAAFEEATGVKKFYNNPAHTNNVAFNHAKGDLIFLMGNEVIAWEGAFRQLLQDAPHGENYVVFSTTFDLAQRWLDRLDPYGSNLTPYVVHECSAQPLQSEEYRSDVTNYLSLCPRGLWRRVGGYDERYLGGISSDDSDFVRRARAAGAKTFVSGAVTLHQYHGGKTCYYEPAASTITPERWREGVQHNHRLFHAWDGTERNPMPWPAGVYGVKEVVTNADVTK